MSSGKTMNIYSFEKGKLEVTVFSIHGKNNKPVFKNNDRSKPLKKKKRNVPSYESELKTKQNKTSTTKTLQRILRCISPRPI